MTTIRVLQNESDYTRARSRLQTLGWDVSKRRMVGWMYSLRAQRRFRVDIRKSWDVAWFAEELEQRLHHDEIVVDVGGVNSELPWALHLAGFQRLYSCDLDRRVRRMPFARHIAYHVGELEGLPLVDGTVGAVTAVSTIEHGMDVGRFLHTASRLLRPNGLLCISTDYWPTPIDVSETTIFGLPWTIFDRDGARRLIAQAGAVGLVPLDGSPEIPDAADPCIHFSGREYTFLGAILRKAADH